jgi:Pyruvate/2-oxoacid:ferredoxin oxidoreductase delta subunit
MPEQAIKFYQVGSFVAGNRLLAPEQCSVQARTDRSNALTSGKGGGICAEECPCGAIEMRPEKI